MSQKDKNVNWGIIGSGNVVEVKSGPSLINANNSNIKKIYNRTYSKAKVLADKMNINKACHNADEIFDDPQIEAVYISTPPDSHYQYTMEAIRSGKHVVVEKPMAFTTAQCEEMVSEAEKYDVTLFTAYYRRFWPVYRKIKSIIKSGEIGQPIYLLLNMFIDGYPKHGEAIPWRLKKEISIGGLFVDVGSHRLDMANYLVGDFEKVIALSSSNHSNLEVEDTVGLLAETKNNTHVHGYFSFNVPGNYDRMEIAGTKGRIVMNQFDNPSFDLYKDSEIIPYEVKRATHTHIGLFNHFNDIIMNGANPELTAKDGCHISKIMEASYQSAEKNQWIEIL